MRVNRAVVADLDLKRRVADVMTLGERMSQFAEQRVAGMAAGHDQVRGKRSFCRAHRPNVEIVDRADAGLMVVAIEAPGTQTVAQMPQCSKIRHRQLW